MANLFFLVLMSNSLLAKAQTQTGSIVGTVQDAGGSVLVSAKITIDPTARQAATNDQGQFRIADLPAGDYTVTVSYVGFSPSTVPVKVLSGQVVTVNQTLKVASGADSVVTGNWGADLALLIKASKESGLKVDYYTYYAGVAGGPSAIGEAGEGHLKQVSHWHSNVGDPKSDAIVAEYKKHFPDSKDDFYWLDLKNAMDMLVKAINDTKSTDPQKVALALEGMKYQAFTGEVTMRADNHQILQPMFVSGFAKAGTPGVKHDVERTGYGFKTEGRLEAADTMTPTTCKMQRP